MSNANIKRKVLMFVHVERPFHFPNSFVIMIFSRGIEITSSLFAPSSRLLVNWFDNAQRGGAHVAEKKIRTICKTKKASRKKKMKKRERGGFELPTEREKYFLVDMKVGVSRMKLVLPSPAVGEVHCHRSCVTAEPRIIRSR